MQFYRKPRPSRTIEDLAYRFLHQRYPLGRLLSQFGRKKTHATITSLADTILLCDPEHIKAQEWLKRMKAEKYK